MGNIDFARELDDDRHINSGASDDAFDEAVAAEARVQAAAIRTNILTGHEQTLHDISSDLGERLIEKGITEHLVRAALSCGPLEAGQMLIDLIQKCIDADADNEALKAVERRCAERDGAVKWSHLKKANQRAI